MILGKFLGAAVLAAVALISLAAASTAVAGSTVLCREEEEPCAEANVYTGHVEGTASNVRLLSDIGTLECQKSTIRGNVLGLASPLIGHLELFSFTTCSLGNTPCTVTALKLGLIEGLRTGKNLGVAKSNGGTEELLTCGSLIHCVYGGKPELHLEGGGEHFTAEANGALLEATAGLLCPDQALYDSKYTLVLPLTLFVST